jgi:hypothetical protein
MQGNQVYREDGAFLWHSLKSKMIFNFPIINLIFHFRDQKCRSSNFVYQIQAIKFPNCQENLF